MITPMAAIVTSVSGLVATLGILTRVSYQLGGLVREFRIFNLEQVKIHADLEARMRVQEQRRR